MVIGAFTRAVKRLVGFNPPKRRKFASIAYDKSRPLEVDGYRKIAEDEHNVAYEKDGKIKVGIAGTHDLKDVATDAKILTGKKIEDTSRYKQSEDFINKIKEQYNPSDISLSGHSLSGGIVNALSKKYGYKGEAFNPFLTDKSQISDKVKNVRSVFDPVSLAVAPSIKTDYSKIDFNPLQAHSISQFD